ncbi:MAG: aminotransferase class I/II-fold pyridoxal phosphate-dependent enzyme, partial [Chrysiogenales bacterium]
MSCGPWPRPGNWKCRPSLWPGVRWNAYARFPWMCLLLWMTGTHRQSRKCTCSYCMLWRKRLKRDYLEESMIELSSRVNTMISSPTLKLLQIKKQLQTQGKVILDFGAGEPDFSTPENIKEAGTAAIRNNFTKYTPTSGIAELKKAIQDSYQAEQAYAAKDSQIVVSPGSKYGLFLLLQAIVDPGDEVIVPLPFWVSYPEMVKFCGGRVVFADHLQPDRLFELTAASYISRCSAKTKAVIVNSPSNPTGKIMDSEELGKLIDYFYKKNILIIIDDCYRKIIYTS